MTNNFRALVICGDMKKHLYFAAEVLKAFPEARLIIERYPKNKVENYAKDPCEVLNKHFQDVQLAEDQYFDRYLQENESLLKDKLLLEVEKGQINEPHVFETIKGFCPRFIAINATSILRGSILEYPDWVIANHHAGLCQYYRGSGNNVWPFVHTQLDKIGVTIHYVDSGLDTGEIILQGRPSWSKGDNTHTIGCKCAIVGAQLMIKTIKEYEKKGFTPKFSQEKYSPALCKKKDFTASTVKIIQSKIDEGIVHRFLSKKIKASIYEW